MVKRKLDGTVDESYITFEIFGGLHLAEPSLTAGRQTKFGQGLKFLKLAVDHNIRFPALFSQGTALFQHFAFLMLFSGKHFNKVILKV